MFQSYALFPHLSVVENVAFALKMKGMSKVVRLLKAQEMLKIVDLEAYAERRPSQLSGGQQQRVALARALITSPSVLLHQPLGPRSIPAPARAGRAQAATEEPRHFVRTRDFIARMRLWPSLISLS